MHLKLSDRIRFVLKRIVVKSRLSVIYAALLFSSNVCLDVLPEVVFHVKESHVQETKVSWRDPAKEGTPFAVRLLPQLSFVVDALN